MEDSLLDQLCGLARIELSSDEREDFKAKFERLLAFVERVQSYAGQDAATEGGATGAAQPNAHDGLSMVETLIPRPDKPLQFEWPAGTIHDYRVPQVISFGEDEG